MKHFAFTTLLSALLCLPAAALAQAQAEKTAAAKAEAPAPKTAKRSGPRAELDARDCLKLPTNMEIHSCSLKYR